MRSILLIAAVILTFTSCHLEKGSTGHIRLVTKAVDHSRLVTADNNDSDWLSYGKNYAEDRFSSLKVINNQNIDRPGLAWSYDLGTKRGIEATPAIAYIMQTALVAMAPARYPTSAYLICVGLRAKCSNNLK